MQCPGLPTADNDTEKLESRIEAVIAALRPQSHSRQEERGGGEKRRAHFGRCVYSSGLFIPQVVLCAAALKAPDDFTALFCQVTSAAASKPTRRPRVKAARFTHTTTVCAPEWVYYYAEAVAANIKELWWDTPSSVTRNLDLMIFF